MVSDINLQIPTLKQAYWGANLGIGGLNDFWRLDIYGRF
jgi:hypothetical protein